jgi:anaerobic magnesium-protoporphyrin IX monomethyl ester cyclase
VADVLLGQGYYLRFDPKLLDAAQPYPPLGTLYAAACVRQQGYRVAVFDAMLARSESEWALALDRHRPRFAVLYEDSFNYLSKMCLLRMRQASFTMIGMARARGCTVLAAGSDASDHLEAYLGAGADAVLLGEAEMTLCELLDALSARRALRKSDVSGIGYFDDGGRLVRTAPRPFIRDLDGLPFPAWDLVDVDRYRRVWRSRHGYHSMNIVTTRGCPYHCNWCAKPIYGQRYAARSPESVAAEVAWLKERYSPDHLSFADDIFGLKPGWVERFAQLVTEAGAAIPFKCLCRADLLLPAVVDALRRARCRTVWIGAESGSQTVLDAMEKGVEVDQIYAAARRLRAAGIEVGFFLQFGYPGETREDIERTLRMVRECRPDDIGVSISYPLPGTRFYDRVKSDMGDKRNWVDSDDLTMMYRGPYETAFYRTLHRVVHKEFRVRKIWGAGRLRHAPALLYNAATLPFERFRLQRLGRVPRSAAWTSS